MEKVDLHKEIKRVSFLLLSYYIKVSNQKPVNYVVGKRNSSASNKNAKQVQDMKIYLDLSDQLKKLVNKL